MTGEIIGEARNATEGTWVIQGGREISMCVLQLREEGAQSEVKKRMRKSKARVAL